MSTAALLVSTATSWLGTARLPRFLAKAGFEVSLLTPKPALAEKSRFVTNVRYLVDNATAPQWTIAFADAVAATAPRLVIPCDDMAFRLLRSLVAFPPQGMPPALALQLGSLIRDSLGEPAWYETTVDKTLLPSAAAAHGVPVPPFAVVGALVDTEEFSLLHGWPVVLKRAHGFAGEGVAVCADRGQLAAAWAKLSPADPHGLEGRQKVRLVCQAYIPGRVFSQQIAAWNGEVVAGYAREKLVIHPQPTGPSTVTRCRRVPEIEESSATLVRAFGMRGLFGFEYIVHERSGVAHLIEINRRVTSGTHNGASIGIDLCAALYAAINGIPSTSRRSLDAGEEHIVAHFPQEWLRDPSSRHLRDARVDAPWDEPELFEALLALRFGS
jgi:hypothetical protein